MRTAARRASLRAAVFARCNSAERLIFSKDGGHAMIFDDVQSRRKITLHQPNCTPCERMGVFDLK